MEAIKIVSFNLKHDFALAVRNRWKARRELITQLLSGSDASIVGVQELMPNMKEDLRSRLSGFRIIGQGRTKHLANEHSAILLRAENTTLLYDQTFWLSKHPEKSGSRAYFAMFPRICTVCEVYADVLQQKIRVFNTHFDHVCGPARTLGVKIILEYMHRLNQQEKLPTILMGDLNAHPRSKSIRILAENRHDYPDIRLTSLYTAPCAEKIHSTYHGFRGKTHGKPIDYIFVSEEWEIQNAYINTFSAGGRYPSDHYPLVAVLGLKQA